LYIEEIRKILLETKADLVILLCHKNADPDTLGAAYAFSQLLKQIQSQLEVEIVVAEGISRISREVLTFIPIEITFSPRIEDADIIFLLDTSTMLQLGRWSFLLDSLNKPIVVIDHHAIHPQTGDFSQLTIICENATSTCEIVYRLFKEANISIPKAVAQGLFLGIVYDTKRFLLANPSTFKTVTELIELGVNPQPSSTVLIARLMSEKSKPKIEVPAGEPYIRLDSKLKTNRNEK